MIYEPKMKESGKVYTINIGSFACPDCGNTWHVESFLLWPEMTDIVEVVRNIELTGKSTTMRCGFCPCGNIFFRQPIRTD